MDLIFRSKFKSIIRVMRFDKPPIIVCGCGRSGTSLMLSILGAHPRIQSLAHETNVFTHSNQMPLGLDRFNNRRKLFRYLVTNVVDKTKNRYCEKTPRNIHFINQIWEVEPNAKIVIMVRDGRDVVTSKHPRTGDYHVEPKRWIDDNNLCRRYSKHSHVHVVKYERLIEDFQTTMRQVCFFLEEEFHTNLETYSTHTSVRTHHAFHGQSVKPLYDKSIQKSRDVDDQRRVDSLMSDIQGRELLKYFGYVIN